MIKESVRLDLEGREPANPIECRKNKMTTKQQNLIMRFSFQNIAILILGLAIGGVVGTCGFQKKASNGFAGVYVQRFGPNWLDSAMRIHNALEKDDIGTAREFTKFLMYDQIFFGALSLDSLQDREGVPNQYGAMVAGIDRANKYILEHKIASPMNDFPYHGPAHPLVPQGLNSAQYTAQVVTGQHAWRILPKVLDAQAK